MLSTFLLLQMLPYMKQRRKLMMVTIIVTVICVTDLWYVFNVYTFVKLTTL